MVRGLLATMLAFAFALCHPAVAQTPATHIALVIGNTAYQGATPFPAATGNASIVAETMRAAGYEVTELRDVPKADIGQVMRDFLDRVAAAGPQAVAFLYFAGHA